MHSGVGRVGAEDALAVEGDEMGTGHRMKGCPRGSFGTKKPPATRGFSLERATRFELATLTLANRSYAIG